jgi:hypothetical protein
VQPFAAVTVTIKSAGIVAVVAAVVAPFDHKYVPPPDATSAIAGKTHVSVSSFVELVIKAVGAVVF